MPAIWYRIQLLAFVHNDDLNKSSDSKHFEYMTPGARHSLYRWPPAIRTEIIQAFGEALSKPVLLVPLDTGDDS